MGQTVQNQSHFSLLKYNTVEEAVASVVNDNVRLTTSLNKVILRKIVLGTMDNVKSGITMISGVKGCAVGVIDDIAPNSRLAEDGFRKGMIVLFHEGSAQMITMPNIIHVLWVVPDMDIFAVIGFNREELTYLKENNAFLPVKTVGKSAKAQKRAAAKGIQTESASVREEVINESAG